MTRLTVPLASAEAAAMLALTLTLGAVPVVPARAADAAPGNRWVVTWQASPQPVWGTDFLFPTHLPAALHAQTVRQVARISLGGERLRIVLSNAYGKQPLFVGKATVARFREAGAAGAVTEGSLRAVSFGGQEGVTIPPGASWVSDPVALPVPALSQVAVSLYLPQPTPISTFHWDGRQTGWIVSGDQTQAPSLQITDPDRQSTTARPLLTGIAVETGPAARAVAVLGDSITDGATASLDKDSRWPDFLAARLAPHGVAVVNAGISGARLLSDGM
ncbi:MAG: SGNH/GDSL hydrolase family protein, partial [Comamonas sp.]|nr:SGNH/GDSL hydrolase family protein [Comamonas sp.]